MKPVRLSASATQTLPRWLLLALCMFYILPGLIRRDPWKSDDATGFGVMWTMASGGAQDWLWPNVMGLPYQDEGPLAFWIGALCIKIFGPLFGDILAARMSTIAFFLFGCLAVWSAAYLLGKRQEAQPLQLAFGGQPEPRDFGRMLADGALLIYLGCLGLLLHSHSTSSAALEVALVAFALYASARLFDKDSVFSAAVLGLGLSAMSVTQGWVLPLAIWVLLLALASFQTPRVVWQLLLVTAPASLLLPAAWLLASTVLTPTAGNSFAAWMQWNIAQVGTPSAHAVVYLFKNGIWFTWPAWPFAGWAVYAWRRQYQAPHITLPLSFLLAMLLVVLVSVSPNENSLLPLLPPLALLAAFGLPTMKRGAINGVDWFSVMTLTTCAAFIWIGWIAKQTGWPGWLARNAFKLAPGFKPEFNLIAFLIALSATIAWFALVQWRVSRRPTVLWRAVVLSSGGVILCWSLLMTLWLPWLNYGKSYASVAGSLARQLPASSDCVVTNAGKAQRASFGYFGKVPFARPGQRNCDLLLLQDSTRSRESAQLINYGGSQWELLWQGRRPADRNERFRLFKRVS